MIAWRGRGYQPRTRHFLNELERRSGQTYPRYQRRQGHVVTSVVGAPQWKRRREPSATHRESVNLPAEQGAHMAQRVPPIEPYQYGMVDVNHGHPIYWECCGNPTGKAALYLHGGPGSGCTPGQRPILRSEPVSRGALANELSADLNVNTTPTLLPILRSCANSFGVDRWTILGLSWGTTLGLAYAKAYPHRLGALVLGFITTTSKREVLWVAEDVGRLFPREWERFFRTACAISGLSTRMPAGLPTRIQTCGSMPRASGAVGRTPISR
jgi:hypothetical protein